MSALFDQSGDLPIGDESRIDAGHDQPEVSPKSASTLSEAEWLSISENPTLDRKLNALALMHYPGKIQKRRDMVQLSLEKLQDLAVKKKAKYPNVIFNPIDHAMHAFYRVRRDFRAKKRRFFTQMRYLSRLLDSGLGDPMAGPSDQARQAQVAYELALSKLNPDHQRIVEVWRTPGVKLTHQKIANICGCSKGTVTNVLKGLHRFIRETMDDLYLC